jgi:hypothetical protein
MPGNEEEAMERSVLTLERARTDPAPRPIHSGWYDPDSTSFAAAGDLTSADGLADTPVNDAEVALFEREGA